MDQVLEVILLIAGGIVTIVTALVYRLIFDKAGEVADSAVHRSYVATHSDAPLTSRTDSQRESTFKRTKPDEIRSSPGFFPTRGKTEKKKRGKKESL
ncbi:MAG: hypothetical protein ACW99U_14435 [Candidatus Thorarchaeota archaeon]